MLADSILAAHCPNGNSALPFLGGFGQNTPLPGAEEAQIHQSGGGSPAG